MRSNGKSTGERTPLMRDKSAFNLGDDTHIIRKKYSGTKQENKNPSSHHRNSSNWTQISDGANAHLSSGGASPREQPRRRRRRRRHVKTKILIGTCYLLVSIYTCVILIGPLLLSFQHESEWCPVHIRSNIGGNEKSSNDQFNWDIPIQDREYNNPDFNQDPCQYARVPQLFWLTLEECDMSQRMLMSVILGGAIGYERRTSDRPAGIRTMGLVSLGACFFTISSILAFRSSTMGWDASRVTAALPSGVGFLGAALIWKGSIGNGDGEVHQVHGLTTAASLWLSAAIGVGAGGALYFVSVYSTVWILLVLRYGPKFYLQHDSESVDGNEEEGGIEESEHDLIQERWPQGHASPKDQSDHLLDKEETLSERSEQPRVTVIQAGFPESLTTEDRAPSRASVQTFGSVARSITTDSSQITSSTRRRHRPSQYDPPTFHS